MMEPLFKIKKYNDDLFGLRVEGKECWGGIGRDDLKATIIEMLKKGEFVGNEISEILWEVFNHTLKTWKFKASKLRIFTIRYQGKEATLDEEDVNGLIERFSTKPDKPGLISAKCALCDKYGMEYLYCRNCPLTIFRGTVVGCRELLAGLLGEKVGQETLRAQSGHIIWEIPLNHLARQQLSQIVSALKELKGEGYYDLDAKIRHREELKKAIETIEKYSGPSLGLGEKKEKPKTYEVKVKCDNCHYNIAAKRGFRIEMPFGVDWVNWYERSEGDFKDWPRCPGCGSDKLSRVYG